jgi:predicted Zn-dependent peptidase
VAVGAGSRDDPAQHHGLAHFVEHTIFKGTSQHSANYILNRMESVGGELNAYTTKEETMVYAVMPSGNYRRATALIAELIISSEFPEREIDKEREVIADEIDSYLDTPSEAVYDDFEDMLFANSALGHNILGTSASIANITSADCRKYLADNYTADNMVYFYSGPEKADKVIATAERYFAALTANSQRQPRCQPSIVAPFTCRRPDGASHQAHTIIGTRTVDLHSPDRHAMALLNNIIGGPGMNALLNVALRERRGLVYTVESSLTLLSDTGALAIYFGCDPADTDRCLRLTTQCIERFANSWLTQRHLEAARRQYLGQLAVSSDNKEQMALSTARSVLCYGSVADATAIRAHINSISLDDLRRLATTLEPSCMSRLTLG